MYRPTLLIYIYKCSYSLKYINCFFVLYYAVFYYYMLHTTHEYYIFKYNGLVYK